MLIARSRASVEHIQRIADGRLVNGEIRETRNPKFDALTHAVMKKIADATGTNVKMLKLRLKAATGHVDLVELPDGRLALHPHPMKHSDMGEREYRDWWEEAQVFIFTEILPGCPASVRREIEHMLRLDQPL